MENRKRPDIRFHIDHKKTCPHGLGSINTCKQCVGKSGEIPVCALQEEGGPPCPQVIISDATNPAGLEADITDFG